MNQIEIPAAFYRGGTSKGVFFHQRDLPEERERQNGIFLQVIGAPDRYRRQLNGMGGGISSLSKVVVISPPSEKVADIDYTFGQVSVRAFSFPYSNPVRTLSFA